MSLAGFSVRYILFLLLLLLAFFTTIGSNDSGGSTNPPIQGNVDNNGTVAEDVTVKAFEITSTGDVELASTTTDAQGRFSLILPGIKKGYLELSKTGFATLNSEIFSFLNVTRGRDVRLLATSEAETIVDSAFGGMMLDLADKAYIAINVRNTLGAELDGIAIGVTDTIGNTPAGGGTLNCNGSLTGHDVTVAQPACSPARTGPMYLAYYDGPLNVTVNLGTGIAMNAPVRMGEVTLIEVRYSGATSTINLSVEEGGRVTTSPNIGTCIGPVNDCQLEAAVDAKVTLIATQDAGWRFDDWDGCDLGTEVNSPSGATCVRTIVVGGNIMRAEFDPL